MSILKWVIKDAVEEGVSYGARKALQPKVDAYTNKVAQEAFAEATKNDAAVQAALEAAKNMKICPSCGTGCSLEMKFCTNCGAKLPELAVGAGFYCPNCGKQNGDDAKFCVGCGKPLNH
ncbi:MAG: zinc ribbon domain-containing protein [Clostridia bacterium]|nr:zinc ribbon domain-containing protein [Clostridia bacterium]